MKGKKAFSLVEVIIATSILTIAVFGVYKLIGENTKIISNSSDLIQVNSLFSVLEECIENLGFNNLKSSNDISYFFNFGNDLSECNTGTFDTEIDNINYKFLGNITNSGSNFIDWELEITSEKTRTITGSYKQIK